MAKPVLSVIPGLAEVTKRVKDGYAEIKRCEQSAVSKAIELGEIFLDMREHKLKHGQFLNWIEKDCGLSVKTVERYITLHKNQNLLYSLDTDKLTASTINSALRQIETLTGKPKGKPQEDEAKAGNRYDKAEVTLLDRLADLKPEVADTAAQQTVNALQAALAEIKKKLPAKPEVVKATGTTG
jgi:hypothetical protein